MTKQTDRKVAIPTIHTNGTSAESLIDDLMNAYRDVGQALQSMRSVTPNGRDYYVQGDEALEEARKQHDGRVLKLADVRKDLEAIIIGIQDQQDKRRSGS